MQKLIWQNANGDEINLTSGNYGITEWEGFSNASLNIQSQQVPFQDGGVFLDALIEQRELSVTLKMQDNGNLEERYRMRRELIHALNPKLGEGYLIYTNDFTSKRIKCVPQIPLFPTHNSNDSGTPSASLAWTACVPYWEDLEETEVILNNGVITNIENQGDVDIGFKAVINPPCVNPEIVDLIEEKKIKIQKSITENTEINTDFGKKSIEEIKYNYKYEQGGIITDILLKDSEIYLGGEVVTKFNSFNKNELIKTIPVIENHIIAGFRYYGGKYYIWYNFYDKFLISEDLQTFVTVTTPSNYSVRKIFYINNKIIVSTGAYTFQYENNEFTYICDNSLYDLIYKNGYYYGLAQYSVLKTDVLDRYSWETLKDFYNEMSSGDFLYELSFENGIFVILMNYNGGAKIFSSTDMDIWNESALINDILDMYITYPKRLCFCNNLFFITTSSYIITTSDGINFNIYESPIRTYEVQTCMNTDGNSVFISNAQGLLISTRNGIAYENILGAIIPNRYSDVKYYNGSYYVSGGMRDYEGIETQGLYKSSDCKKWDLLINGFYVSDFVIFGNSFIGKRNASGVISIFKSNGVQFAETFNASLVQYGALKNIVCNDNQICAVTEKGYIIKSNNGIDWDIVEIDTNKTFNRIAICNNQFVIVGNNGVIYTSNNLTDWVLLSTSIDENINDIIFKKFYLICTSAGKIYRSNNLLQFEFVGNYFTRKFYEIFSNIEFINNGVIVKTQDGNTFIEEEIGVIQNNISACLICGHNGKFLIGQINGLLYDSTEQKTNIIDKLTSDSDMSLKIKVGKNQYKTQSQSGNFTTVLSYRQKYIGV